MATSSILHPYTGPGTSYYMGGFAKIGDTILGGRHKKDYSSLGSILRSPYFGKLPFGSPKPVSTRITAAMAASTQSLTSISSYTSLYIF